MMNNVSTVAELTQLFDHDGELVSSYQSSTTTLNESGEPVEKLEFAPTGIVQVKKRFGPKGLLAEETAYNPDGSVNFRNVFSYDDQRERESEMRLSDGSVHGRWSNSYNEAGKLIERVWMNRDGVKEVTETSAYDEHGRLIRKARGNVAEWRYSYDDRGRLAQVTGGHFSDDEPDNLRYQYDDEGRVSKITALYPSGEVRSLTTCQYST
jgi:YD repeat-containing protein